MLRKILLRGVAPLCAAAALTLGTIGWIGSERALRPHYYHYQQSLASFPALHAEPVRFHSSTGIDLVGRWFRGTNRSTIVLANGYGDTQDQMLPIADFLHRAGFNVLTYNMRARGDSGGDYVTLGVYEQKDLISALDYLCARSDVDPQRIGALGISMGGAVVILAAAQDKRIQAVVDDCGFSDAPSVIAASFEHFIHLPAFPFAPVTIWIADERAGIDVDSVRPMDVIARISPRPVLIIHGLDDYTVPVANSKQNFAHAREPKQLWLVPGAKHGKAHSVAKAEYERRVTAFFDAALQNAGKRARGQATPDPQ
ncbi:MAG TPA: alpha/beta hydrolase [Bryobacteraceae bacterium]|nr:alpha/beta hydrolase [Bryobacteraceae bacterium]